MEPRPQQHCPGPPDATEVHARSLSHGNSDDIQQLRTELQLCHGKLKGYEILGHLFQESKQECARYKMQNEDLMKKIENLTTSHLCESPVFSEMCQDITSGAVVKPGNPGCSKSFELVNATSDKLSFQQRSVVGSDESCNVMSNPATSNQQQTEQGRGFSLTEVGAKTPPALHQGSKSGRSSGSSSPSFIQISESDITSPAPSSLRNKPSEQGSITSTELTAQTPSVDMTYEINQVTEQMKKLSQSSSSSSIPDLSADLIRAGVHVLKLQKQNRVQQVVIEKMNTEIVELKVDNADKQQFIQQLQSDCKLLSERVKQLEGSRGKALQEAQTKILETAAADPEDNFAEPSSAEWVEVENHQASGAKIELVEAGGVSDNRVTATSLVEMELKRRVEKLTATIAELVVVNRNWDEYCRDIEARNSQQMTAMQTRLAQLQNVIDENERSDQKRQQEFDSILLNCKQQREAEEMAKEDALNQLHREHQQRTEAELKCMEFSRKTVELEARLFELHSSQPVHPAQYKQQTQHLGQTVSAREQELYSQLVILQEQINVFKEDFDQERSDREATRGKMDMMRNQLADARGQINVLNTQLAKANADLKTTKRENEQWKQRFHKLTADLDALRRHAQSVPQSSPKVDVRPVNESAQQIYRGVQPQQATIRRPSWPCIKCTFKNSGARSNCEVCGAAKYRGVYQTDVLVGGRPVAGMQEYSPHLLYSPLVSRSLETDEIDNQR